MANNLRPEVKQYIEALRLLKAQGVKEGDPVAKATIDRMVGEGAYALYGDFDTLEQFLGEVRGLGGVFAHSVSDIRDLQIKSRVGPKRPVNAANFAKRHLTSSASNTMLLNRLVKSGVREKLESNRMGLEDIKSHGPLIQELLYAAKSSGDDIGALAFKSLGARARASVRRISTESFDAYRNDIRLSDFGGGDLQEQLRAGASSNLRASRDLWQDFEALKPYMSPAEAEKYRERAFNTEEKRRNALLKSLGRNISSSLGRRVPEEERLENARGVKEFLSNPLNTLSDPYTVASLRKKFEGRAEKILTTSVASPAQQEIQGWLSQFVKAKSDVASDKDGKPRVMPLVERKQNVQAFAEGLKKELDKRTEGGTKAPGDKETLTLAKLLERANTYLDRIDKGIIKQTEQSDKRAKDYQRRQAALDREIDRKFPLLSKIPGLRAGGGGGEPPRTDEEYAAAAKSAADSRRFRRGALSLLSTAVTAGIPAAIGLASDYYSVMAKSPLTVIGQQQKLGAIEQERLMGALSITPTSLVEYGGAALFPGLRNTFAGGVPQQTLNQVLAAKSVDYSQKKEVADTIKDALVSAFSFGTAGGIVAGPWGAGAGFVGAGLFSLLNSKTSQRLGILNFTGEYGQLLQQERLNEYVLQAQQQVELLRAQEMGRNQLRVKATDSFMALSANNLMNARVAGAGRAFDLVEFSQRGIIDLPRATEDQWKANRLKFGPIQTEKQLRERSSKRTGEVLEEYNRTDQRLNQLVKKGPKKDPDFIDKIGEWWFGTREEQIAELKEERAKKEKLFGITAKFADYELLINEGKERDQAEAEVMQKELFKAGKRVNAVGWMRMGFSPEEYASTHARIVAGAGRNMGAGAAGRDKATSITSRLLAMSLAGTGSVDQLIGNMGAISAVTGQADVQSKKSLEDMMTEAIKRGFDNSRTAQAMVQMSVDISSKIGIRDPFTVQRVLAQGGMGLGGSEADFSAFAKGASQIGDIYKNPAIHGLSLINYKMTGGLADKYSNLVWQASQDYLGASSTTAVISELEELSKYGPPDSRKVDAALNKLPPSMQGVVLSNWKRGELGVLKGNLMNSLNVTKDLARNFGQGTMEERNAEFDKSVEILKEYAKKGGPKTDTVREAFSILAERFTQISGGSPETYQALTSATFMDPSAIDGPSPADRAEYEKRINQGFGQGDRFSVFSRARKAMDMMLTGMFTQSFDKKTLDLVTGNLKGKSLNKISIEELTSGTLFRGYLNRGALENFRGHERITEEEFKEALRRIQDPKYKKDIVPTEAVKTVMETLSQTGGMNAIQESIMAAQSYGRGQDVYITNASEVGLNVAAALAGSGVLNPNK